MTQAGERVLPLVRAVALLFLAAILTYLVRQFLDAGPVDFVAFWAAGKLALAGDPAAAWDIAAHRAAQGAFGPREGVLPFAYPPPFLLPLVPLGALSYPAALSLWVVLTLPLYLFAARLLFAERRHLWFALAFPPVLVNGVIGQAAFITAGLFVGGVALVERRPLVAGLLLGGLVIKPHLALLIPFALLAGGRWRVIGGAATSSVGLLLAALLAFGADAYAAFLSSIPAFGRIAAEGLTGWHKFASIYALLRSVGAPEALAWAVHILAALGAAAIALTAWRRNSPARVPMLAAAAAAIPPYIYAYDLLFLIAAFVPLLRAGFEGRLTPWQGVLLALIWTLPLAQLVAPIALTALIAPALLLLIVKSRRKLALNNPSNI